MAAPAVGQSSGDTRIATQSCQDMGDIVDWILAKQNPAKRGLLQCYEDASPSYLVLYFGVETYATRPIDGRYVKGKLSWSFATEAGYLDGNILSSSYDVTGYSTVSAANHEYCSAPVSIAVETAGGYRGSVSNPSQGVLAIIGGSIPFQLLGRCETYFTPNFADAILDKVITDTVVSPHFTVSCRRDGPDATRDFDTDHTGVAALDVPGLGRETMRIRSTVAVVFGTALPRGAGCTWPTQVKYTQPQIHSIIQRLIGAMI